MVSAARPPARLGTEDAAHFPARSVVAAVLVRSSVIVRRLIPLRLSARPVPVAIRQFPCRR